MEKEIIEEIFDKIRDCLDFHFRNAESKEDLIERISLDLNKIEEEYTEE